MRHLRGDRGATLLYLVDPPSELVDPLLERRVVWAGGEGIGDRVELGLSGRPLAVERIDA